MLDKDLEKGAINAVIRKNTMVEHGSEDDSGLRHEAEHADAGWRADNSQRRDVLTAPQHYGPVAPA